MHRGESMTNEALEFLKANPVQYLSTVDESGNPRGRPFMFMFEKGGKPYYCTSNKKDVYAQMKAHPCVEISTTNAEFAWIRLSGTVEFVNDIALKEEAIKTNELVRNNYKTADNPELEVFTISGRAIIADLTGQPPKAFSL